MNRQVEVGFSIGKYEDSILCDVVPMEACHLLLAFTHPFELLGDEVVDKLVLVDH